jgi:hypothetical protein
LINQEPEKKVTTFTHLVVLPRSEITDWVLPAEVSGTPMLINVPPPFYILQADGSDSSLHANDIIAGLTNMKLGAHDDPCLFTGCLIACLMGDRGGAPW